MTVMSDWLGIVTNLGMISSVESSSWWCVPAEAKVGDTIFLYCPASASRKYHGVFAKAEIVSGPAESTPFNSYCRAHSNQVYGRMLYVSIEIKDRFSNRVTAKDLKSDVALSRSVFVRRNFQGTCFAISASEVKRLHLLIGEKSVKTG